MRLGEKGMPLLARKGIRKLGPAAVLLAGVVLTLGCSSAISKPGGREGGVDNVEFRQRTDQLADAYRSLDVERISAFYAPDALATTFDLPAKYDTGQAASQVTTRRYLDQIQEAKLDLGPKIEVWTGNEKVWTLRDFNLDVKAKSGATLKWAGQHSAIWEKRNGVWLIANEHFLKSPEVERPAPPPPPVAPPPPPPPPPVITSVEGYLKDVFFDLNKWDIRPDQRDTLLVNAEWLKANPAVAVTIEGHCDERGGETYNDRLGEKRAEATKAYLVGLGVEGARLSTISFGKKRPFETGRGEPIWQQNRRSHFVITKGPQQP